MLVFQSALLSVLLLSVDGFAIQNNVARPRTTLSVANDVTTTEQKQQEQKHVPYEIARGDGSTGGGGLPMPKGGDDGLVRPKVGAEMPEGRPSWFRVPGPSQGKRYACILFSRISVCVKVFVLTILGFVLC